MFKFMNWKHWLLCQASAIMAGYLAWSASGNPWISGGVMIGVIVVYTFMLAGRDARGRALRRGGRPAARLPDSASRQQRRAAERAGRKQGG